MQVNALDTPWAEGPVRQSRRIYPKAFRDRFQEILELLMDIMCSGHGVSGWLPECHYRHDSSRDLRRNLRMSNNQRQNLDIYHATGRGRGWNRSTDVLVVNYGRTAGPESYLLLKAIYCPPEPASVEGVRIRQVPALRRRSMQAFRLGQLDCVGTERVFKSGAP